MDLNEVFPSRFLKATDLKGREVTVVIAAADVEMLGNNERKLVLEFQGKEKQMICNKTNAGRIAYLYGEETNDWIGKEIVLASELVEFQGKTVPAIRVKPPAKRGYKGGVGGTSTGGTGGAIITSRPPDGLKTTNIPAGHPADDDPLVDF